MSTAVAVAVAVTVAVADHHHVHAHVDDAARRRCRPLERAAATVVVDVIVIVDGDGDGDGDGPAALPAESCSMRSCVSRADRAEREVLSRAMRRAPSILAALIVVACGGARPSATEPTPSAREDAAAGVRTPAFAALLRESWERSLVEDPIEATSIGDHRYDDRLPDLGPEAIARRRAAARDELARARALEAELDPADRVTWRLFVDMHETEIATEVCESELWNDSPMLNLIVFLNMLPQIHAIRGPEDARTYEARLRGFGRLFDQDLANLREGVSRGLVAPRATLERLHALVERTLAQPTAEWTAVAVPVASVAEGERDALRARLVAALDAEVRPAIARFGEGLVEGVIPHGRDAAHEGIASMPRGAECYAAQIRRHTSLARTAEELHALGVAEIARTDARMIELGGARFSATTTADVITHLRTDASLGYATEGEIVADARARIVAAEERAPQWFTTVPTTPCAVIPIPPAEAEGAPFGYYVPGSPDGTRAGGFFVNASHPETRRRHMLGALVAHEAVPGHHFQISIAQSLPAMPMFRRHGHFTAYVEGWGLYAERLADEMGLYEGELDRLGANDLEAFRAARLVVDTGVHAMGWSRTQAEEYLRAHTSMSDDLIANEVDRYLNWPGQALAYKVGQLELIALRTRAQTALGDRFDARAFHELVLGVGPVSLTVLGELVDGWIATVAHGSGEAAPSPG